MHQIKDSCRNPFLFALNLPGPTPHSRAPWTSPFFEDVSGDSPIFEDPKMKSEISTSPFFEDASGETLIFNKHVLSQECAKTTSETTSFDISILMRMSQARASFLKRQQIRKLTQHLHVLRTHPARALFLTNDVVTRTLQHPNI